MGIRREEQSKSHTLAECEGGIPVFVAGLDVDSLAGIRKFKAATSCFPGPGRRLPSEIKGGLQSIGRGLRPGKSPRGTRAQVEIQEERRIGSRAGRRSTGQKEHRKESVRLAGQDVDHLHL